METCCFGKLGYSALSHSQTGTFFFPVLSTFLKTERIVLGASPSPHVLAPLGMPVLWGGCEPQTWLQGSAQCLHSALLQPLGEELCPPFAAPTAQTSRLVPLLCSQGDKTTNCHWTQVGGIGFTALLAMLVLWNSPKLPLPNVSFEVSTSTEAGQWPLSTASGNPSCTRMLNLWPSSNLTHPPLPTVHYRYLHSWRCVLPEPILVFSGSHRSTVSRPL